MDPAGSKHVGVCYVDDKTLFVHLFVISDLYATKSTQRLLFPTWE
jgi:hypothetical protein